MKLHSLLLSKNTCFERLSSYREKTWSTTWRPHQSVVTCACIVMLQRKMHQCGGMISKASWKRHTQIVATTKSRQSNSSIMVSSSHCANISHTETITHYVPHPKKLGLGIKMTRIWQGKVCRTLCSTNGERRKTTSSSSYTLDQPSLELEPGMKTRFANKQVNCSQSQMKLSFTCAFTTTVKHGKLKRRGNNMKITTYKFQ